MADDRPHPPHSTFVSAVGASLASLVLVVATLGCGADEEAKRPKEPPARGETTGSGPTASAPSATAPPGDAPAPRGGAGDRRQVPEAKPGGAGDEEAARTPADLTGRGGQIRPRTVRVPPFLAVRVTLRSADGRQYALRFGSRVLRTRRSASIDVDGLRPGARLEGRPLPGSGTKVVIQASTEPGP